KQTSTLRADTPVDHVVNDLRSAFDGARPHRGAVGELDLVMKLEELPSRLGIQGDHGSLAVLIADEYDSIADGQRAKGLPTAQSAPGPLAGPFMKLGGPPLLSGSGNVLG